MNLNAETGAKKYWCGFTTSKHQENLDSHRLVCHLDAEGFLSQPASGCSSVVLWREGVCDP